jgi:hypothetical protein
MCERRRVTCTVVSLCILSARLWAKHKAHRGQLEELPGAVLADGFLVADKVECGHDVPCVVKILLVKLRWQLIQQLHLRQKAVEAVASIAGRPYLGVWHDLGRRALRSQGRRARQAGWRVCRRSLTRLRDKPGPQLHQTHAPQTNSYLIQMGSRVIGPAPRPGSRKGDAQSLTTSDARSIKRLV